MDKWKVQCLEDDATEGMSEEELEEVDVDEERSFEISVIRSSNKHGQESGGWGDENKIILFGSELGENHIEWPKQKEFAMKVARLLRNALNQHM